MEGGEQLRYHRHPPSQGSASGFEFLLCGAPQRIWDSMSNGPEGGTCRLGYRVLTRVLVPVLTASCRIMRDY